MRRTRHSELLLVFALVLAVMLAACAGDGDEGEPPATTPERVVEGGTLVVGADGQPDCADWIASCAGDAWGAYMMSQHVMPRAFDVLSDGRQAPSALLAGEPKLEAGPPQKVTYKINPEAIWSDGTAITSADFKYTWEQIVTSDDIYDRIGYERIESVDVSDPKTAVVTFWQPYADWKDLFGSFFGIYPSHLLEGKDRHAAMKDGNYAWSGGPWIIEAWIKGQEVRLIRNENYWGEQPHLDRVVFRIVTDTATLASDYTTRQLAAIYPQAHHDLAQLKGQPTTSFTVAEGVFIEGLWLNTSKPPLESKAVRQALTYATDRDAIVKQLFGGVKPDIEAIQSLTSPANKTWYTEAFAKYQPNEAKVDALMEGDGWAKGVDEKWAKNGQKATLTITSTAGNKRRELMGRMLEAQWEKAGFDVTPPVNQSTEVIVNELLPRGDFQLAISAQFPQSPTPAQCMNFCSKEIPSAANNFSGSNWWRISDPSLDEPWMQVDTELDVGKRKALVAKGYEAIAELVPMIPIDAFPTITVYDTAKLGGAISDNPVYGMFWNMNEWYCKEGKC